MVDRKGMKMGITAIGTIFSILLGGGILTFIQFLISRKDKQEERNNDILHAISELDLKIDERFNVLDQKIDQVDSKGDERAAVVARVRILRFADEMREHRLHSKDSWDQVICADITDYEKYCRLHPDFKNNQTEATVAYIKKNYEERLEKNDFL